MPHGSTPVRTRRNGYWIWYGDVLSRHPRTGIHGPHQCAIIRLRPAITSTSFIAESTGTVGIGLRGIHGNRQVWSLGHFAPAICGRCPTLGGRDRRHDFRRHSGLDVRAAYAGKDGPQHRRSPVPHGRVLAHAQRPGSRSALASDRPGLARGRLSCPRRPVSGVRRRPVSRTAGGSRLRLSTASHSGTGRSPPAARMGRALAPRFRRQDARTGEARPFARVVGFARVVEGGPQARPSPRMRPSKLCQLPSLCLVLARRCPLPDCQTKAATPAMIVVPSSGPGDGRALVGHRAPGNSTRGPSHFPDIRKYKTLSISIFSYGKPRARMHFPCQHWSRPSHSPAASPRVGEGGCLRQPPSGWHGVCYTSDCSRSEFGPHVIASGFVPGCWRSRGLTTAASVVGLGRHQIGHARESGVRRFRRQPISANGGSRLINLGYARPLKPANRACSTPRDS